MAYGYFVHCLDLPAGARVLEIGFGAGGLTELLVRSGLDVTAVELRESNCETLRQRVGAFQGQVTCIKADSVARFDYPDKYDAIIFYEAFHHMPAPLDLLRHLKNYLTPTGLFAFGAEPIQPPSVFIPFPWGLRMDGGSLGAIRDVGWVEFGFHEDFFIEMLSEIGNSVTRSRLPGYTHCDVWIARQFENPVSNDAAGLRNMVGRWRELRVTLRGVGDPWWDPR
jgi:SAM-dependent methyltransferase